MKDIFEGQPLTKEAPQGLRNKVEFEARQPQKASWFNGGFKWAATGTLVAAATIGGFMIMTPATAKSWNDVTEAYQDVRSALIQFQVQDENGTEEVMFAMKGNQFRVYVEGEMDMSMNNGEMLMYEYGSDTALLMQFGNLPIPIPMDQLAQRFVSEFSMTSLLKRAEGDIGENNIEISDVYQKGGRSLYDVRITNIDGEGRAFATVDANSDLPLELRVEEFENGQYKTEVVMSFRFNEDVDDSLLETVIPSGVKTVPIDMGDAVNGQDFDFGGFGGFGDHDDSDDEVNEEVTITRSIAS